MKFLINKLFLLIFIAPAVLCHAESNTVSGNITLATDYVFRGQSQTDEHIALQGGFDWTGTSGFYMGMWGSNVEFGTEAQAEVDYYAGFTHSLSESVDYDIGYIYYSYVGENALDYQEVFFSFSFSDLSFAINYSDEYLGDGGSDYYYLSTDYSVSLPNEFSLDLHLGVNKADGMDITFDGSGNDNYADWSVGLAREFNGLGLSLSYTGTDISNSNPLANDRLVFSISKSL